jgi:hypothetical protein
LLLCWESTEAGAGVDQEAGQEQRSEEGVHFDNVAPNAKLSVFISFRRINT